MIAHTAVVLAVIEIIYWFTFKLPPVATVTLAPGLTVMLLQLASTPLATTGLNGRLAGIITLLPAEGTMPDDQLAPLFQAVLVLPTH